MSKTLKEFASEFKSLEKRAGDCQAAEQSAGTTKDKLIGLIQEYHKELAGRVQQLKDEGREGKTIDDFEKDRDVKKLLADRSQHLDRLQKEYDRGLANRDAARTVKQEFEQLQAALEKEIAARKKKQKGLIKVDSKSLPDMEKLLAKVKAGLKDLTPVTGAVWNFEKQKQGLDRGLTAELATTKAARKREERSELDKRQLDVRILKTNLGKAKKLHEGIKQDCTAALKAPKADSEGEPSARHFVEEAYKKLKELSGLVTPCERALKDVAPEDLESKDGRTVSQAVHVLSGWLAEGKKLVTAVARKTV